MSPGSVFLINSLDPLQYFLLATLLVFYHLSNIRGIVPTVLAYIIGSISPLMCRQSIIHSLVYIDTIQISRSHAFSMVLCFIPSYAAWCSSPVHPWYSLPLRRVHEIKHMYLVPHTHGLFITWTHSFIRCIFRMIWYIYTGLAMFSEGATLH